MTELTATEPTTAAETPAARAIISVRDFNFFYGKKQALQDINLDVPEVLEGIRP